jgi:hypothetical protein
MSTNQISEITKSSPFWDFGGLLFFAMILPGFLGYCIIYLFFLSENSDITTIPVIAICVFMTGFVGNFFGHFIGYIHVQKVAGSEDYPFILNKISLKLDEPSASRLRKDLDYWYAQYCWYWNSAITAMIVTFFSIILRFFIYEIHIQDVFLFLSVYAIAIPMLFLASKVLQKTVSMATSVLNEFENHPRACIEEVNE